MKKDWYDGDIAVTNETKALCYVIRTDDSEFCIRREFDGGRIVHVDESYTVIKEDVMITLEYDLDDDDGKHIGTIYSIDCQIYEEIH